MPNTTTVDDIARLLPALVVLLQNAAGSFFVDDDIQPAEDDVISRDVGSLHEYLVHMETVVASVLHDYRLRHVGAILPPELGWWVLPHSTT